MLETCSSLMTKKKMKKREMKMKNDMRQNEGVRMREEERLYFLGLASQGDKDLMNAWEVREIRRIWPCKNKKCDI